MKSNKIYVIQMHTHTMPSRLIKLFTHYKYSHIAISLTPECDKIYSFGRKELNSIINSGFVIENRDGDFFNKFNETTCRIFEIEVTKKQYRNLKKIIPQDPEYKIHLFLEFSENPRDIADPWYTGDFDKTYEDIVEGCQAFLKYLQEKGEIKAIWQSAR